MGVPAFFKWLCMRCPKILHDVIEDDLKNQIDDEEYLNQPDLEVDNLYLDMNGIIHPCTHPENSVNPITLWILTSIANSSTPYRGRYVQ